MDAGRLLEVLVKRWKTVLLVPLAAGVAVYAAGELLPPEYEAIRMIRLRSSALDEAAFEREFSALYQYGKSPQVASRVMDRAGQGQDTAPNSVEDLLEAVTVAVPSGGDTLIVSVRSRESKEACQIADAWVDEVVTFASGGEGARGAGQALDDAIASARQDLDKSRKAYQEALFLTRVGHVEAARDHLYDSIETIADARQQRLESALQVRLGLERDASVAAGLGLQIDSGGEGAVASSWPALVDLKLGVYGGGDYVPSEEAGGQPGMVAYQIDGVPPSVSAAEMVQDIEALQQEIESRLSLADAELSASVPIPVDGAASRGDSQTEAYWAEADLVLADLVDRLAQVDADLVEEEVTLALARLEYEQAKGAFESVLAQESQYEQEHLRRRMQYEKGPAAVAQKESAHTLRNTMLAILAGALLGVCMALLAEYWSHWREASESTSVGGSVTD